MSFKYNRNLIKGCRGVFEESGRSNEYPHFGKGSESFSSSYFKKKILFGFCESNPSHPTLFFFLLLFSLPSSFFPPSPALSLLSPPSSPSLPLLQGLCSLLADSLVGGGGLPAGCPFCPAPLEVAACPARPPQSPPLVQEVVAGSGVRGHGQVHIRLGWGPFFFLMRAEPAALDVGSIGSKSEPSGEQSSG